jgi:hypothetical protein
LAALAAGVNVWELTFGHRLKGVSPLTQGDEQRIGQGALLIDLYRIAVVAT